MTLRSQRKLIGLASAVLAGTVIASPAEAAVTCSYDATTDRVTISLSAPLDQAGVRRIGNAIGAGGTGLTFAPCGAATVRNTRTIVVAGSAGGPQSFFIDLANGDFQPGTPREPAGVSEIEFEVDLGGGSDGVLLWGGPSADNIRLGAAGSNLNGDNDVDVVPSRVDGWALSGFGGNDQLGAQGGLGTGAPYLLGEFTYGETTLDGGPGHDVLTGGPIRETFYGQSGRDAIRGGGGSDLMYGDAGADRLFGGADGDGLYPGPGDDLIAGGGGGDSYGTEAGAEGADEFRGGPGVDRVSFYSRTGRVRVDLDGRADDGLSGERDNIRPDVEEIYGGSGADRLIGNGAANLLYGDVGADRLEGHGGDDELVGGGAENEMDVLLGGAGDDSLESGGGGDILNGGADDDELFDDLGSDTVSGGSGNDQINQGSAANGGDALSGGRGLDEVSYASRGAAVNVSVNNVANDGGAGEADNVRDDVEIVVGTPFGDTLTGNGLANFFGGGGGADILFGFDGIDRLIGEAGVDNLNGGDGLDYLDGGSENDTINAVDNGRDEVDGGTGAGDNCNTEAFDLVANCEL